MALERAIAPHRLYAAVNPDVNPFRPLFTGDIFSCVAIPGVGKTAAIVIGHPCSFRGRNGRLAERTPVASVTPHQPIPAHKWSNGFFNRMPLPDLSLPGDFHVARLDLFGLALTSELLGPERIACLSHAGINQLQQRIVFHQTRLDVPTIKFQEAFAHTYEEADLLEEWNTELEGIEQDAASSFESWIREDEPSRQSLLTQPQDRAHIRRIMRQEIRRRITPGR